MLHVRAQSITLSAVIDEHLTWRRDGDNLIISTNKSEGFTFITNDGTITKKGPVIFTIPAPKSFYLVSSF